MVSPCGRFARDDLCWNRRCGGRLRFTLRAALDIARCAHELRLARRTGPSANALRPHRLLHQPLRVAGEHLLPIGPLPERDAAELEAALPGAAGADSQANRNFASARPAARQQQVGDIRARYQ